ncbi:3-oxo-5-alpha-steroid 4-dehydrogenase-domain-containing protein [Radiomyces spectabilis]|uniref:3-oxo-5-alpha-steroid 4-dehydrogenase-domain-containing protein n=1 Tax=Radiomyces spectabilis TaxID=64574 RepID=UPI00221E9CB9|nr:3-oxo-5-alpha-steroid 4-dehydrogenase-domain-containing protein [Radiomyces spectabilis]KAI8384450.1 3-oxo-5-alpha-steroid 4-dehydrogenase-domain-containing protein [Radiomyces spectabilis]
MKITIASRNPKSSKFPVTLELAGSPDTVTVHDVCEALHKKFPKYYPARQRLTTQDKQPLDADKTLTHLGIADGATVMFKDLGPQIGWRTVFLVEYGGPLLIHPLFFYLSKLFYGRSFEHSTMQTVTFWLVMVHFLKRELETLFVHRFSHGTMPLTNLFKNSAHYWFLSGINLAYWVYGPWYADAVRSDVWLYGSVAVWAWAELSNLCNHITLRNLRPPGTRTRAIPYGYGFDLVSCPNYFFEFISWTSVCFLTTSWSAFLFNIVATGQMYIWAVKKHKIYRKEFKGYPRNRKAMFPFIA